MIYRKAAVLQDLSCFGKCSLSVTLPVLSAFGIETSVIPASILSAHTGGLGNNTFLDLTDEAFRIIAHWKSLGLRFNALYSGWLASPAQTEMAMYFFDCFSDSAMVFVDPAMADNGKLYRSLPSELPENMSKLCKRADFIIPNITEAHLLLGLPYNPNRGEEASKELCARLLDRFESQIVLTGTGGSENETGCTIITKDGLTHIISCEAVPGSYHGCGDLFSSVLLAHLLRGRSLPDAAEAAVRFVSDAVRGTAEREVDPRFGLLFEETLSRERDIYR